MTEHKYNESWNLELIYKQEYKTKTSLSISGTPEDH